MSSPTSVTIRTAGGVQTPSGPQREAVICWRASDTAPAELVRFLDRLYTDLDALVDRHGLEKVKTSGA